MAIASTTGKPSTNSARKARTTMNPLIPAPLCQDGLLRLGPSPPPSVGEHRRGLDDEEGRAHRERPHEQPERHLEGRGLVVEVVADRDQRGGADQPEQKDAGDLDRELQQPARARRDEGLELLHLDLPALGRDVGAAEEGQADEEVARHLLGARHRHVEDAAHDDLRQRRDDQPGEERKAEPAHEPPQGQKRRHRPRAPRPLRRHFTARICSMWLVQSGKSFATCASTAVRKAAMSSPSFSSTKTMPLPSRSERYFAAVSLSQARVLRPTSVITSSMILRSASGTACQAFSLMKVESTDCM